MFSNNNIFVYNNTNVLECKFILVFLHFTTILQTQLQTDLKKLHSKRFLSFMRLPFEISPCSNMKIGKNTLQAERFEENIGLKKIIVNAFLSLRNYLQLSMPKIFHRKFINMLKIFSKRYNSFFKIRKIQNSSYPSLLSDVQEKSQNNPSYLFKY